MMRLMSQDEEKTVKDDPLLTPEEFRGYLKVAKRTFATWRAAGHLPVPDLAVGKTIRWRWSTIEAWLAAQRPGGGKVAA
jgi:hypothetical protein